MSPDEESATRDQGTGRSRRWLLGILAAGTAGAGAWTASTTREVAGQTASDPTLAVSPTSAGYDEAIDVTVDGLGPEETVTITARATDRDARTWGSFARFETPGDGTVSLADQAPSAGTYDRQDPTGLVWSMRPTAGTGSIFVPPRDRHELVITARTGRGRIGRQTVVRRFGPPDLVVEESPDGLVGQLYRPPGAGPFPGVIVLHGSGGRPDRGTAILLASHGYAVFAPQYIGSPEPLPDDLAEVPLEYLDQSAAWLASHPAVGSGPIGLFGTSKGAELALLLGATYDWVGAVVANAPSGLVWAGLTNGRERTSSWSLDGDPVPFVPTAFPPEVVADYLGSWPLGGEVSLRPTYEQPLETVDRDRIEQATIPVERIDGPVALVAGEADALWPSARLGRIAAKRLAERDHPHSVRVRTYPEAGHGISFPHQPTTGLSSVPWFPPGTSLALGGTPAGLSRAASDAWPAALSTLQEGLR